MIQNVSLDLWGTVLKTNPRFKRQRAEFIKSKYKLESPLDLIEIVLKKTGNLADNIDKNDPDVIHSNADRYKAAYDNLGIKSNDNDIQEDIRVFDEVFLENLPDLYDSDTQYTINRLRRRVNTLTVISNTGYLDGYIMREGLTQMGLADKFNHMLFSDELKVSKPHRGIFDEWAALIADGKKAVNVSTFLHVGDDKIADYEGPKQLKMESFLINGKTGRNIKSVITFLDGKV